MCDGDRPIARPLPTQDGTNTEHVVVLIGIPTHMLRGRSPYVPYTVQPLRSARTDSYRHNHVYYIRPRQLNLRGGEVRRAHGHKWNARRILSVLLMQYMLPEFTAVYLFELQNVTFSSLAFSSHQLKCLPVSIFVFTGSANWRHSNLVLVAS
jgi:hypothetical protein